MLKLRRMWLISLCLAVLTGCQALAPATPTSTPTVTPAPTLTPTVTPTPGPPTATPIPAPAGLHLVWHDEFDGPAVDTANWGYDNGAGGWGNGELQYYTYRPENARVEDGQLVIEARQENLGGALFSSARLKSQGLQEFQYGWIEARAKVPAGAGLWPAFWMLGNDIATAGWPRCGEIDIMEYVGREPRTIYGTLHGPGYSGAQGIGRTISQPADIAADYHVFAVDWEPDRIDWYYDGVKYHSVTPADLGTRDWVANHPFFLILNLAVGGSFAGMFDQQTVFPAQLRVDYVRVFQK